MHKVKIPFLAAVMVTAALLTSTLAAAQQPDGYIAGEKWRMKMSMSMEGFSMPAMTSEVCTPLDKGADEPSVPVDGNCQVSNYKRSGNTESFRMVCGGPNPMEGTMEITRDGPDQYRGKMIAKSKDGEMTMHYEGTRLPGSCDAAEVTRAANKAIAQQEAQIAKAQAEICKNARQSVVFGAGAFSGTNPQCTNAADKQAFCTAARSYDGFGQLLYTDQEYARLGSEQRLATSAAAACGFDAVAHRSQLCSGAQGAGQWGFLARNCSELADVLASRECAGRAFTGADSVAPEFRDFCSAYALGSNAPPPGIDTAGGVGPAGQPAGSVDPQDGEGSQSVSEKAKESVKESLNKLRGILRR
ncbi:DUF3617 domain-containing protein [Steroidobacter denitrificans]|nr:DUF3617 family protein [Steroidobacter denitrificans]